MKQGLLSLSFFLIGGSMAPAMAQQAAAVWEMTQTTGTGASVSGPLKASEIIIEGGKNHSFSTTDAVFKEASMAITTTSGTTQATEEANYYIEYAITPKEGITFLAEELSFDICGKGGSNMRANFYYSKDHTFATKTKIAYRENTDLTRDNAVGFEHHAEPLSETVAFGETLYFRIYPYYKSVSTGKYICPRNVAFKGSYTGEATVDPAQVASNTQVTFISTTTAFFGGSVLSDGGGALLGRGVVWNTAGTPTIDDFKTEETCETGSFESKLTGLQPGTTYYTRAYATNKSGTYYGNEVAFKTLAELVAPTVTQPALSKLTNLAATVTYQLTAWGGSDITESGIVYAENNAEPTVSDMKLQGGTDLIKYTIGLTGLRPETTYHVRAYATNATGTAYSPTLTITTKATEPDVEKVIDPAGKGDYTTVKEAFAAVPAGYTGRWIIRIKPGIYDERVVLPADRINVWLIGEDAATTIITGNATAGTIGESGAPLGTNGSMTVAVDADDFVASKITIRNTFVNSKENVAINPNTQAVALRTKGDRQAYYDCNILGFHDTFYGNSEGRVYFKNCVIEGNVDFIFGNSTVVFDGCTTVANRNGSVITAPSTAKTTRFGMVFLDCNLTGLEQGTADFNGDAFTAFYLGRPWQNQPKSAFIRCEIPNTLHEKGWTTMNGGLSPVFVEHASSGPGATPDLLAKRGNEGLVITEADAGEYTVANVFAKTSSLSFGADWLPAVKLPEDIVNSISGNVFSDNRVKVFPSIFSETCTLQLENEHTGFVAVKVFDVNGMQMMQITENVATGTSSFVIDGKEWKSGIYFYSVITPQGKYNGKIIRK